MKQFTVLTGEPQNCPIGLTVMKNMLHFSVIWPGSTCSLVIFQSGEEEPARIIPMDPALRQGDVWNLTLAFSGAIPRDLEYCCELDGVLTADPYGRTMRGWEKWGDPLQAEKVLRSPLRRESFDWGDDASPGISLEDSVIYRIHTRGFTRHVTSGVRDKGTFKGIQEKIPYLKELGITTVELMPPVEFQEIITQNSEGPFPRTAFSGRLNYWGYCPGYYFAPKASFSCSRQREPMREFKTLVKSLHAAGLELIVELFFQGNENPAFVLDVARYWVTEFHLDGLHLTGNVPAELIARDPYLSGIKLLTTNWYQTEGRACLADCHDGFQNDMRRFLKGYEDMLRSVLDRVSRGAGNVGCVNYMTNTNGFTLMDLVSYDRKHNEANGESNRDGSDYNYSWNCGEEGHTKKKKVLELRRKQIRNALLFLMLSQGTPLLLAGDEFGNTGFGNNNAYCQDNEISWLNWKDLKKNQDIWQFARHAIAFRKAHPVLHMKGGPKMMDHHACGYPDLSVHGVRAWYPEYENFRRQLGLLYCGLYGHKADGSPDDFIFVMYNMHWEPAEFAMPNLPKDRRWYLAMDTELKEQNGFYEDGQEPLLENQRTYLAAGRSAVVLVGKTVKVEEEPKKRTSRKTERKETA